MTVSEFEYIMNTSNVYHLACSVAYEDVNVTSFTLEHLCGNKLIGRAGGNPPAYDIVAKEGDCTSVKIVQPKDVLVYIKRIFGMWEEQDAQKSAVS